MLREFAGNSKATSLAGDISASATSVTVADGTGYPTGAVGPFVVTIDAGLAAEEKVLCTSRTGNTLTVSSRGWDGTTATDHSNAATVQHTFSATDAREANAHVNDSTGDPHPQYLNSTEGNAAYVRKVGGDTITASGAAVKGLVVRGAASQTANLAEFQNSAGTVLSAFRADGALEYGNQTRTGSASNSGFGYALPASPAGFCPIYINGTLFKFPIYAA